MWLTTINKDEFFPSNLQDFFFSFFSDSTKQIKFSHLLIEIMAKVKH